MMMCIPLFNSTPRGLWLLDVSYDDNVYAIEIHKCYKSELDLLSLISHTYWKIT